MQKFEVKDHAPGYLPEGNRELIWTDEFDGTELDRTKWDFRLNFWGEPFEAFTDQGVVPDGNSHMEMHRTRRNGCYVSPQPQTGSIIYDAPKEEDSSLRRKGDIWPFDPGVINRKIEGEFVDDAFIVDFVRVFYKVRC